MKRGSTHSHAPRWLLLIGVTILAGIGLDATIDEARAAPGPVWKPAIATWYGPGFYGNRTACGQRYTPQIRGVAVPSRGARYLPCGTRLTICRARRCVWVRVIDTGGFRGHQFDLSARTAMDLCRCWRPYTQRVVWRKGFHQSTTMRKTR